MKKCVLLFFTILTNAYVFSQTFSGTYTIGGASPNYSSINAAITALKGGVVVGPITYNIRDGVYNESISISEIIGTSPINTITFQSQSLDARKVIINGMDISTVEISTCTDITLRHLTIQNMNPNPGANGWYRRAIVLSEYIKYPIYETHKYAPKNVTISDCIVKVDTTSPNGSHIPIYLSVYSDQDAGTGGHIIRNNTIIGGQMGISSGCHADISIINNRILQATHTAINFNVESTNLTISGNYIQMRETNAPRPVAYGIYCQGVVNSTIANNVIAGGFSNAAKGAAICVDSLWEAFVVGSNDHTVNSADIYHNSILYDGMYPEGSAIQVVGGTGVLNIKNNLFINTGPGYAYVGFAANTASVDPETDYNDYYASGSYLGNINGTRYATLGDFKTATGKDANSISYHPFFVSPSDLHVLSAKLDGKATPTSVTIDYDGQSRNASAPDIGADEFTLPARDIALVDVQTLAPAIHKDSASIRVMLRSNGLQSLKDSIISVSYSLDDGATWTVPEQVQITSLINPDDYEYYTFKQKWYIDRVKVYHVKARINPPGLLSDNIKINDQAAAKICVKMKGVYKVADGDPLTDFSSLSAAVEALNCGGITGPVELVLKKGIYNEHIILDEIPGSSAANTVVIRSESGNPEDVSLEYGFGSKVIQLNGSDYVTIDGITIFNKTPAGYNNEMGIHLTNQADHNTIKNCMIKVVADGFFGGGGIIANPESGNTGSSPVPTARYLRIENNTIEGGKYGIYLVGAPSVADPGKTVILNNRITKTIDRGIATLFINPEEISGNYIELTGKNVYDDGIGIFIRKSVLPSKIQYNYVSKFSKAGIYLDTVSEALVANNTITEEVIPITQGTLGEPTCHGIAIFRGKNINVYYNSVLLRTDSVTAAFFQKSPPAGDQGSGLRIKNNIFTNRAKGYAYYVNNPATVAESDNNVLYTNGPYIGYWDVGGMSATLQDLQDKSGKDANSTAANPAFQSNKDLHLTNESLQGKAQVLADVKDDYDHDLRSSTVPTPGSDDFRFWDIAVTAIEAQLQPNGGYKVAARLENRAYRSLIDSTIRLSYSVDNGSTWTVAQPYQITGLVNLSDKEPVIFQQTWNPPSDGTYPLCVRIEAPGILPDLNKSNDIFCAPVTVCAGFPGATFTVGTSGADFLTVGETLEHIYTILDATCGLSGPIVIQLQDGIYNESLHVRPFKGASPGSNITIRSISGNPEQVMLTSTETYTVLLDGASYLTIENITVANTGTDEATALLMRGKAYQDRISHCILTVDSTGMDAEVNAVVLEEGDEQGTIAGTYVFMMDNSVVNGGFYNISIGSAAKVLKNVWLQNNTFRSAFWGGILATGAESISISGNTLLLRKGSENSTGIEVVNGTGQAEITRNYLLYTGTTGIHLEGFNGVNALIANNMIAGGFSTGGVGNGIFLKNSKNVDLLYNSVDYDSAGAFYSFALYTETGSNIRIFNNIFSNTGGGYAYYIKQPNAIAASDHNNLYSDGSTLAYWGADKADLAALKAASGKDNNSLSVIPGYVSNDDLHVLNAQLNGAAIYQSQSLIDFDGQVRNATSPDIGADEFSIGIDGGVNAFVSPNAQSPANSPVPVTVTIRNYGNTTLSNFPVRLYIDGSLFADEQITDVIPPNGSLQHTFANTFTAAAGNYTFMAYTAIANDIDLINDTLIYEVEVVPVGIDEQPSLESAVYPNPAISDAVVSFGLTQPGPVTIELFDMHGRSCLHRIQDYSSGINKAHLSVSDLMAGIYFLRISSDKQQATHRLSIIH